MFEVELQTETMTATAVCVYNTGQAGTLSDAPGWILEEVKVIDCKGNVIKEGPEYEKVEEQLMEKARQEIAWKSR